MREAKYMAQMGLHVPDSARQVLLQVGRPPGTRAALSTLPCTPAQHSSSAAPSSPSSSPSSPSPALTPSPRPAQNSLSPPPLLPPLPPQEEKYKYYFNQLSAAVKQYEGLLGQIQPVVKPLLRPHLLDMEQKLAPGMFTLTWTSLNIDGYLHRWAACRVLEGLPGA